MFLGDKVFAYLKLFRVIKRYQIVIVKIKSRKNAFICLVDNKTKQIIQLVTSPTWNFPPPPTFLDDVIMFTVFFFGVFPNRLSLSHPSQWPHFPSFPTNLQQNQFRYLSVTHSVISTNCLPVELCHIVCRSST